jgi:5-methylcytosine-specific restriction endonuclease McrA
MKTKKPNAELVWKQIEDDLVPRLRLSVIDRAVYSHLLRHSRLEGRLRLRFSIPWLARGARLSVGSTRQAVRRLFDQGVLRLIQRSKAGHVIEVRLPEEIPGAGKPALLRLPHAATFEDTDFLQTKALRQVIHARERGLCFYCLRRITASVQCLDHVVPRVHLGRNSYRNLVSCCLECNSQKGERPAEDFLRQLYRQRRLTAIELADRLRALDALASGKLPPPLATSANPLPRKGRPPLHPTSP